MAKEEKHDADLLPRREALSLINTDPSAYSGLLGTDPTTTGPTPAPDPATSAAGSAQDLVDADAGASGEKTYSDEPQTVTTEDTQTASSQT